MRLGSLEEEKETGSAVLATRQQSGHFAEPGGRWGKRYKTGWQTKQREEGLLYDSGKRR
jgi:hypothetical protein